jgi:hypothetical protein
MYGVWRKPFRAAIFLSFALSCPPSSVYALSEETGTAPVVVEEREKAHPLEIPLGIPPLIMRGIGLPFRNFGDWSERVDLRNRVIDFFFNDARTAYFYPAFRLGGEGGFFAGLGAAHRDLFHKGYGVGAKFSLSPRLDQNATLSFSDSTTESPNFLVDFSTTWRLRQKDPFYGIGNDSNKTSYNYESRLLTATVPVHGTWGKWVHWKVFGQFTHLDLRESDDPSATLGGQFGTSDTVGIGQKLFGGEGGAQILFDSVEHRGTPGAGTIAQVQASRFEGEHHFRFFRSSVSAAHHFTAFKPGRVFVVGLRLENVHTLSGEVVPFPLLPTLGGGEYLRGFPSRRFSDKSSLLAVLEYRYPVWKMVDGTIFAEGGRVASGIAHLNPAGFHPSGGFGFRFRTLERFFFYALAAGSREGPNFILSLNQAFE